jgi:hypothetical protein
MIEGNYEQQYKESQLTVRAREYKLKTEKGANHGM